MFPFVVESSDETFMNLQRVTITLPEPIYQRVKRRSQQMQRSVADELAAVVAASLPEQESVLADIEHELSNRLKITFRFWLVVTALAV